MAAQRGQTASAASACQAGPPAVVGNEDVAGPGEQVEHVRPRDRAQRTTE